MRTGQVPAYTSCINVISCRKLYLEYQEDTVERKHQAREAHKAANEDILPVDENSSTEIVRRPLSPSFQPQSPSYSPSLPLPLLLPPSHFSPSYSPAQPSSPSYAAS